MQGMIKMLEEKVEVKCLKRDVELVKKSMVKAQELFGHTCEVKTELKLSDETLPDS